ncbi:hypothetical protein [Phormidium sp. FACHB-1136]|uniref:hypothetical protein n=1 Tax=Phormidium sp. FACHB-1136 TaxID=2692848 RepID=UPI001687B5DF|nr:hypothetical protein [Phormidium sp. FACHB-1136]MBD2425739.1 hypothetical protein [Phormidium sp. FACHB-1136]
MKLQSTPGRRATPHRGGGDQSGLNGVRIYGVCMGCTPFDTGDSRDGAAMTVPR